MKSEGAWLGLEEHAAFGRDEIQAIRPARVSRFDAIVEAIDHGRKFNAEFANTGAGDGGTLRLRARSPDSWGMLISLPFASSRMMRRPAIRA